LLPIDPALLAIDPPLLLADAPPDAPKPPAAVEAPEPAAELPAADDPEPQDAPASARVSADMLPMMRLTDMKVPKPMTAQDPAVLRASVENSGATRRVFRCRAEPVRSVRSGVFPLRVRLNGVTSLLSSGRQFWIKKSHASA
jgi:hypothetical protein